MNGTVALVILLVGVAGGLVLLGNYLKREFASWMLPIVVAALISAATVWAGIQLFAGVFSLQGLAYSFHLGPPGNLVWPAAVQVTTQLLTVELVAGLAWAADYYTGRGPQYRPLHSWAWGHVSAPARILWHLGAAPVMKIRDAIYHRKGMGWPARPAHRFELAILLGELAGDILAGMRAVTSTKRWAAWLATTRADRTTTMPAAVETPFTVDGDVEHVETVQTWHAPHTVPGPRDADERVTAA